VAMWYHQKRQVRFECTGCGGCCTGTHEHNYIEVTTEEQQVIIKYLGISTRWFQRRYRVNIAEEMDGLAILEKGHCVFLQKGKTCRIYPVRPQQCRTYPFWPEIMQSKSAWLREKQFCEGIGRGETVPKSRIIQNIKEAS
jgi:uncharacterized protein